MIDTGTTIFIIIFFLYITILWILTPPTKTKVEELLYKIFKSDKEKQDVKEKN